MLSLALRDGPPLDQLERQSPVEPRARTRLGEILLASGEISRHELRAALNRKHRTGRRIGEELVAAGLVSADRLSRALRTQRRLMVAALFTALVGHAGAAEVRAQITVSATVVDTVGIKPLYQAQDLVVTSQDIKRGFVEVPAASRFDIRNKGLTVFEFRPTADIFRSVKVTSSGAASEFGLAGGTLLQTSMGERVASVSVNYRFVLAPGVAPGTYRWPLALTVLPM